MLIVNKTSTIITHQFVNPLNPNDAPEVVRFLGTIEIDDKKWEEMKMGKDGKSPHKILLGMLDDGMLEEIRKPKNKALEGLKVNEAVEVIQSTTDVSMLEAWSKGEAAKNVKVKKAIKAQIDALEGKEPMEAGELEESEE